MKGKLTETILRKLQPKEKPYKIIDAEISLSKREIAFEIEVY